MKYHSLIISIIGALSPGAYAQNLVAADLGVTTPFTPGASDYFGEKLAMAGDWAIAGARLDDGAGASAGTAYVLRWTGSTWVQSQELVPNGLSAGDGFGASTAIHGNVIVVGAPGTTNNRGAAYVFVYDAASTSWVEQQVLAPTGGTDRFGQAVALSSDYLVVGSPKDDIVQGDSGSATVYLRDLNGTPAIETDDSWNFHQLATPSPGQGGARFGTSIAMDGDSFVVGAPLEDAPASDSGAAWVFERSGANWNSAGKLFAFQGASHDHFGEEVAIAGGRIVCGAPNHNAPIDDQGAAFVFEKQLGQYTLTGILLADDALANDHFGSGLAVSGDTIVVGATGRDDAGASTGAAYLFLNSASGWASKERVTACDADKTSDFGDSISIDGNRMLIGATRSSQGAANAGAVYGYILSTGEFQLLGFGDGSLVNSPCSNNSLPGLNQGAENSTGYGARLTPMGSDVLLANDLRFAACNLKPFAPALLFSGPSLLATPIALGDGLLLTSGPHQRFAVNTPNGMGATTWAPDLLQGTGFAFGETHFFQAWYRDPASPCGSGFSTSNGVAVTFQ